MKSGVQVNIDASKGVDRIIKALDKAIQKDGIRLIANTFIDEVNKYVPESSGNLKKYGYTLHTYTPQKKPAWFKVTYRNTSKLPYVMYQYYGEVWGPNKAVWSVPPTGDLYTLREVTLEHTGWVSPISPKRKTNRILGHPARKTIELRDGRVIHITGYTGNKQAQARWLEYVRTTPTVWNPLRKKMLDEAKTLVKQGLNNG